MAVWQHDLLIEVASLHCGDTIMAQGLQYPMAQITFGDAADY